MEPTRYVWLNGELVDWADATVHVGAHGLHYGSGVFEGIRAYPTEAGPAVFRLTDHLERFERSAQLLALRLPFAVEELREGVLDLLVRNELEESYIRPIAFFGAGPLGVAPRGNPVTVAIMTWPWGAYLGEDGVENGIRVMISSWQRIGPNVIPHAAKATGLYLNSMLAVQEANAAGYDEAILLTEDGAVADGSGENVFVVTDGVLATPALSASILPGITRDSVLELASALGYEVVERRLIRSDLYLADEVFLTGTAAEVTPVRELDGHVLGKPGPVTRALQEAYQNAVRGRDDRWQGWLERPRAGALG